MMDRPLLVQHQPGSCLGTEEGAAETSAGAARRASTQVTYESVRVCGAIIVVRAVDDNVITVASEDRFSVAQTGWPIIPRES